MSWIEQHAIELGHLSVAINTSATSIVMDSGEGSAFSTSVPYAIRLGAGTTTETVTLTAIAGDTLTVTRSGSPSSFEVGAPVFVIADLTQPRKTGTIALLSDVGASAGPGSPSGSIQWNNAGSFAGAANANITSDGDINLDEYSGSTALTQPATGGTIAVRSRGGRRMLSLRGVGESYYEVPYQPGLGAKMAMRCYAGVGSSSLLFDVSSIPCSAAGTAGAVTPADTDDVLQLRRISYVTSSTGANLPCGVIPAAAGQRWPVWRSTTAGRGGFWFRAQWAGNTLATNGRACMALCAYTGGAISVADPSAQTNIVGVGCDGGSTNWSWMYNDGAGVCTTSALGANFPVADALGSYYDLVIGAAPGATEVLVSLRRRTTGGVDYWDEQTFSTNIPTAGTLLYPNLSFGNSSSGGATSGFHFHQYYIDSDY